jgi:hypothetical protein
VQRPHRGGRFIGPQLRWAIHSILPLSYDASEPKSRSIDHFRRLFMTDRENQPAACGCEIGLTDAARSSRRSGRTIPAGGEEPATSKNTKMGDLARRGKRIFATTVAWFPSQALGCQAILGDRRRSRANGPQKRTLGSEKRPAGAAPCGFNVRTPILWKAMPILSIASRALRWSTADRPRQIVYRAGSCHEQMGLCPKRTDCGTFLTDACHWR